MSQGITINGKTVSGRNQSVLVDDDGRVYVLLDGISTASKQDEIITAIQAIGGSPSYSTRIKEDSGDSNLTYIGNAALGSSEASAVWQIKRLDATTGLIKLWCDGDDSFNNVWNNRESLTYS